MLRIDRRVLRNDVSVFLFSIYRFVLSCVVLFPDGDEYSYPLGHGCHVLGRAKRSVVFCSVRSEC